MDTRLQHRLYLVAKRLYLFQLGWSLALVWLLAVVAGYGLLQVAQQSGLPKSVIWTWLGLTAAATLATMLLLKLRHRDLTQIASRLEDQFPALNQRLITAVSLRPNASNGKFGYLQRSVISEAIRHDFSSGWHVVVPSNRMAMSWCSSLLGLGCVGVMAIALLNAPSRSRSLAAMDSEAVAKSDLPIILPGDASVERGSSVIVTAKFEKKVPDAVWLVHSANAGEVRLAMKRSLNDPIFAAYLYDLKDPLKYRVEYDGKKSDSYQITVFEFPAMVRADAKLEYPSYTGLEAKTIADTRRVSAAVGSKLTWQIYLNKAVVSAELVESDVPDPEATTIKLLASAEQADLVEGSLQLMESKVWILKLVDEEGRKNQQEVTLRAKALPNEAAKIKLVAGGDVRVSPLQEFDVGAKINDDFGIEKVGIGYQFAGGDIVEIASENAKPEKEVKLANLIDLESLKAETNQLLSYYVWAEERDEAGELRRSVSDIFFAEVRPLEEIFRQGEQPTDEQQQQQQQQGSQETEELLELQKQIIAGTWNVARTAKGDQLPDKAREDLELLADSQTSAIEKLAEQAQESTVPDAEEFVANAAKRMQQASEQLIAAGTSLRKKDVQQALGNEQAAYQELLRLQSREHEVVRSQQSQSQQQQPSKRQQARQQQLNQLELKNQENRYESERVAQEQQTEEQSAMRQVISRLRELATRQEDLNEQLREVEAALQAAKTEQEREELQRQLERLREQQQQMLQDSDELQEKMDSQPNSEAMQSVQQQMEETRENLQQSAEALNKGNTSQALSSGTRAEQQLNQMQDDMRQQAANQFSETMLEMKQEATEIEERQQQIVEQMSKSESKPSAGLRASDEQAAPQQQLDEQRKQVEQLLENMEHTVQQAEDAEPLLAQRLYDSYRKAQQQKIEERLKVTEQLLERNLEPQARQQADQSLKDVSELRKEIDRAAEAVLGSEVDSLRLALNQIETLSDQLDDEISQATGQPRAERQKIDQKIDQRNDQRQVQTEPNQGEQNPTDPNAAEQGSGQPREGSEQVPNNQQSQQPGQQQLGQQQLGQQPGEQPSQQPSPQPGQQPGQPGQQPNQAVPGQGGLRGGDRQQAQLGLRSGQEQRTAANGGELQRGREGNQPFTGDGFRQWSDRLRDVEELVSDPDLRWQATQIRQAARDLRSEAQRHSKLPEWSLVKELIASPLRELEKKVSDELIRRAASKNEIVPIDRDPVPSEFSRSVRQYYENLGSGR